MPLKPRTESDEMKILRSLNARMELSFEDKQHYSYLKKGYEGNYYYENDNFYHYLTKKKITNPLHQSNRSETLLHQFLQKNGFNIPIESFLNFINPTFYLYQAPFIDKIVFSVANPFSQLILKKPIQQKMKWVPIILLEFVFFSFLM